MPPARPAAAAGKLCDSIKKLEDLKVKVAQLIAAGRFTTGENPSGEQLVAQADAAIACIDSTVMAAGSCTLLAE
jgi:hypothetical protein